MNHGECDLRVCWVCQSSPTQETVQLSLEIPADQCGASANTHHGCTRRADADTCANMPVYILESVSTYLKRESKRVGSTGARPLVRLKGVMVPGRL